MIPPRFRVTVDGIELVDGTLTVSGMDGEFRGPMPPEMDGKVISADDPSEITVTFKAWTEFTFTKWDDDWRMTLRWRHA